MYMDQEPQNGVGCATPGCLSEGTTYLRYDGPPYCEECADELHEASLPDRFGWWLEAPDSQAESEIEDRDNATSTVRTK